MEVCVEFETNPLKITEVPDLFKEIAILVDVFSTSEEKQKAFLALHPLF